MPQPTRAFWDERRETMDPAQRSEESLSALQRQLARCYAEIPFYRRLWDEHGFTPERVRTWRDFTKHCPTVTKSMLVADQERHPPYGSYLGIDPSEIFRVHGSSGTSGRPTLYGVSRDDWDRALEAFAMTQWAMGVRPGEVVHITFPFSLFFAGWGVLGGAERIGASCFPIGFSDTSRHVELLWRLGSRIIEATPSYLLHMAEVAQEMGYDPATSPLQGAIVGGEPGGSIPSTRQRLLDVWGLRTVCDSGSSSEMFPFCTNSECTEMTGPHLWMDEVWTEVVRDDDPHSPADEGELGAVVYTHLWRRSQPMIRFAPGDAAAMTTEPCPCGRTYPRLPEGVVGRLDDMLVIRGVNVYPSAVERALREIPGLGMEFRIFVDRTNTMAETWVEVELDEDAAGEFDGPHGERDVDRLAQVATERVRHACHIRIPVSVVRPGHFPRTTLKARRVISVTADSPR